MTGEPDSSDAVLSRAAQELRDEEQPRWTQLSGTIIDYVRTSTRRGWPVAAELPGERSNESPSTLHVVDFVVRGAVVAALREDGVARLAQLRRVELTLDGHECTGVSVDVAAVYGSAIADVSETVTAAAHEALSVVLGSADGTRRSVSVHVVDVVVDDSDRPGIL